MCASIKKKNALTLHNGSLFNIQVWKKTVQSMSLKISVYLDMRSFTVVHCAQHISVFSVCTCIAFVSLR